jgi:predicted Kef-type K+ transport protein
MLAYLGTGIVLANRLTSVTLDASAVSTLATIGVAFLLFSVGMELEWRRVRSVGRTALVTGLIQVGLTTVLGDWLARGLGFSPVVSLYLGLALAFASTIVVVAALDHLRELDTLHGRLLIGILLVQDLIAIVVLVGLGTGLPADLTVASVASAIGVSGLNVGALVSLTWLATTVVLPFVFDAIADSLELTVLAAIGWMFLMTGLASWLGLSVEIGALLAGVSLAPLPQSLHLRTKIRPLRDFFLMLFFVALGLQFASATGSIPMKPLLILSLFVLIGHPLIFYGVLGALGWRARTAFLVGLPTAQTSEFSHLLVGLGISLGHLSTSDGALITGTMIVTFVASSYLTQSSHSLYRWLQPLLTWPPRRTDHGGTNGPSKERALTGHSILVGARHLGQAVLAAEQRAARPVVVIDLDPTVVDVLARHRIPAILGDATEEDVLESANAERAAQLISTVAERDVNEPLVRLARSLNHRLRVIVVARTADDALRLYAAGADYVVVTHHISGDVLVRFLREVTDHPGRLRRVRTSHIDELKSDHLDFRLAHHHIGERRSLTD